MKLKLFVLGVFIINAIVNIWYFEKYMFLDPAPVEFRYFILIISTFFYGYWLLLLKILNVKH